MTLTLFTEPIKAADGHVYERSVTEEFTQDGTFTSPMTQDPSRAQDFEPAHDVREQATKFRIERSEALAALVSDAAREQPLPVSIAMAAIDRLSEYLTALKTADVALLAPPTSAACDALLKLARSKANPQGSWKALPKDVRKACRRSTRNSPAHTTLRGLAPSTRRRSCRTALIRK